MTYSVSLNQDGTVDQVYGPGSPDDGVPLTPISDEDFHKITNSGNHKWKLVNGALEKYERPETDAEFNAKVLRQIAEIERREQLPEAVREYLLDLPGANGRKGFAKVKQIDDDIAALKATLRT